MQDKTLEISHPRGMADGKPFSTWLSGELLKRATARTEAVAGGNNSKYVRDLIERDLAGTGPSRTTEHPLHELAREFHPVIADDIATAFPAGKAQAQIIARVLEALLKASGDKSFDGRKPFELVDPKRIAAWEAESEERIQRIAERVAFLQVHARATRIDSPGAGSPALPGLDYLATLNEPAPPSAYPSQQSSRPKRTRKSSSQLTGLPRLQPHDETHAG